MDEVLCYQATAGIVTERYFPHYNHLYSVAALTDSTGAVTERFTYDSYGRQGISSAGGVSRTRSAVGWDRSFTGYIADQETGLLHARARQYSPTLGRFIGRDPAGYVDGAGLYNGYFAPNGVDPLGLETRTIKMGGGTWVVNDDDNGTISWSFTPDPTSKIGSRFGINCCTDGYYVQDIQYYVKHTDGKYKPVPMWDLARWNKRWFTGEVYPEVLDTYQPAGQGTNDTGWGSLLNDIWYGKPGRYDTGRGWDGKRGSFWDNPDQKFMWARVYGGKTGTMTEEGYKLFRVCYMCKENGRFVPRSCFWWNIKVNGTTQRGGQKIGMPDDLVDNITDPIFWPFFHIDP